MGFGESAAVLDILLQAQDKTKDGLDSASGRLGKLGDVLGLAGKAAALTGGAMIALGGVAIKQFVDAGDAAEQFGKRFGLLPETASKWMVAGKLAGVSSESLDKGFLGLSRTMNNMNLQLETTGKVGKAQAEVFKEIGVSAMDAHGHLRPLPDVLLDVANRFQKMPDGAEKAGLAMKLFGKSGAELIPFLDRGSAGIKDLMQQAQDFGLVMSEKDVQAAKQFHQSLAELKLRMEGVGVTWGRALMPLANDFFEIVDGEVLPAVQKFSQHLATTLVPKLESLVSRLWDGGRSFENIKSKAADFLDKLKPLIQPLEQLGGQLIQLLPALGTASNVMGAWSSASSALPGLISLLVLALQIANPLIKFMASNSQVLVPLVWGLVFAFQAMKLLSMAQVIIGLASSFIAMAQAEGVAAAVTTLLDVSMLPITLTLLAIAGVVALVALAWKNNWFDIQGKTAAVIGFLQPLFSGFLAFMRVTFGLIRGVVLVELAIVIGMIRALAPAVEAVVPVVASVVENVRGQFVIMAGAVSSAVRVIAGILRDFGGAYAAVQGVVNSIRNLVSGMFSGVHIPLPHFSVSGDLNPADWVQGKGVPGMSVSWYGSGGDFVAMSPRLIGVGDRPERVTITPLGSSGGGGVTIGPIYIQGNVDSRDRVQELAEAFGKQFHLRGGRRVLA